MKRIYKQKKTIIIILGFFVIFISFIYLNVERDRVGKIETVSFTSLCSIFSLFVACGALGYAVRGQPELLEAVKEVTKAIQDLRKAIIEQGIKTTIPR